MKISKDKILTYGSFLAIVVALAVRAYEHAQTSEDSWFWQRMVAEDCGGWFSPCPPWPEDDTSNCIEFYRDGKIVFNGGCHGIMCDPNALGCGDTINFAPDGSFSDFACHGGIYGRWKRYGNIVQVKFVRVSNSEESCRAECYPGEGIDVPEPERCYRECRRKKPETEIWYRNYLLGHNNIIYELPDPDIPLDEYATAQQETGPNLRRLGCLKPYLPQR